MKARWFTTFLLLTGSLYAADAPTLKLATIQVVDQNGLPITNFTYDWWYETPAGASRTNFCEPESGTVVDSTNGTFTVMAPSSCRLFFQISQRDLLSGYGRSLVSYLLSETNTERLVVVRRHRGIVVEGTVTDAATGRPVKEARVCPLIFTPPLFLPDRDAEVLTDANGRFEVHGVDEYLGIHVSHGDYLKQEVRLAEAEAHVDVKLKRGAVIRGRITSEGKPVADARIADGTGKGAISDKRGNFELRGAQRWWGVDYQDFRLEVEKDGFVDKQITLRSVPRTTLRVELEPLYELPGRVLTPEGKPVPVFTTAAGPGKNPADFEAAETNVVDAQGNFLLRLEAGGNCWLGVRAEGYAPWEGNVHVSRKQKPALVTLNQGVEVTGKVAAPEGKQDEVKLQLVLNRAAASTFIVCDPAAVNLATRETTVGPDGSFRFEHVRPDHYWLKIAGSRISPLRQSVVVGTNGLDLGLLTLKGTGRIVGRACHEDGHPMSFANGEVTSSEDDQINFQTDEHGFFSVESVPTGIVSVRFPFHATADIIEAHVRDALVAENETTEVRLFDPSADWTARFKIVIGDGSQAKFDTGTGAASKRRTWNVTEQPSVRLLLRPVGARPCSFAVLDWEDVKPATDLLVKDVQPGSYFVRLFDFQGTIYLKDQLPEQRVEIAGNGQPVTLRLAAGSVTGRMHSTRKTTGRVFISAVSKNGEVHHAYCDRNGNFCLRYLASGSYTIYAHDTESGWTRLTDVSVADNSVDVGERSLRTGGKIAGAIRLQTGLPRPDALHLISDSGAGCDPVELHGTPDERFELGNLWPAKWTLRVLSGEKILAERMVTLRSREKIVCDFDVQP